MIRSYLSTLRGMGFIALILIERTIGRRNSISITSGGREIHKNNNNINKNDKRRGNKQERKQGIGLKAYTCYSIELYSIYILHTCHGRAQQVIRALHLFFFFFFFLPLVLLVYSLSLFLFPPCGGLGWRERKKGEKKKGGRRKLLDCGSEATTTFVSGRAISISSRR